MQHLQPNTTLQGGKYRIERVLGQGGFGITYLAMQTSLQRKVAIKEFFMKDFCSRDDATSTMMGSSTGSNKLVEQYKKKFVKEARNLAKLSHPNIINVIDVFEENDTVYYVMPYLSGGSLQDYVKSRGALSETEAMKYVRQIAKALKYMHEEQHMCHYDVKPANILLDDKGNAVLIDFGISKGYDEGGHETSTTPIGLSEGYAPIEQYQQGLEEFSPASDVYALGATLYFLLHGKRPISAIDRVSGKSLSVNSSLSENIKRIIDTSLKVSKTERVRNIDVFLTSEENSYRWYILLALLIIVGGIGLFLNQNSRNQLKYNIGTMVEIGKEVSDNTINNVDTRALDPIIRALVNNMVRVEGGTFIMGATTEQGSSADEDEKPIHQVTLSSFSIGKFEVTQEEWNAVMGSNPSYFKGSMLPVESVNWNDCQTFIRKLNELTGMNFRLPTEAEWEFAARGGNRSNGYMYAGSNSLVNVAWYEFNNGSPTHEVGQKKANELGIYDMSGNVWEWCADWYGSYSSFSQTNPKGASSGSNRVIRGGSLYVISWHCRVSSRGIREPLDRSNNLGFRLAL